MIDVLKQISGLSEGTLIDMVEEVKRNNQKLSSCKRHDFNDQYICQNCGGKVDAIKKHWYDLGLIHG